MPDDNKFAALREAGYTIPGLCGSCVHGQSPRSPRKPAPPWGTCDAIRYEHLKHDNPEGGRGVSIHRTGQCKLYVKDPFVVGVLGAHLEFFDDGSGATDSA